MLDTCVLVPSTLRDVLLQIAEEGVFRPLWSSEILSELDRTIRDLDSNRGIPDADTDAYLTRLNEQMKEGFPDAEVIGWEPYETTITLPDKNDRHVVAAAIAGKAEIIVTDDKHGFTSGMPENVRAQLADDFLLDSLSLNQSATLAALARVSSRTGRKGPRRTPVEIVQRLQKSNARKFGAMVLPILGAQQPGSAFPSQ